MTTVASVDPRTGAVVEEVAEEATPEQVDATCCRAALAASGLESLERSGRAAMLRAMAEALEADDEGIIATADRETALGPTRLGGELRRTCYQLRLFAEALDEGSYLEATIDHAGDTAMGPRPDLRRMLVPLGPVAVFGSSNFPLAFSVPGGDTVSALAAGCPVVAKAHPAHPATSERCLSALQRGARAVAAPEGTIATVHGVEAGVALVRHQVIRAVAFTGSLRGGRALFDIACSRPDPIPFYGELGSLNPVIVTPAAAEERPVEIARGFVGSFSLGVGQFCTKPGLLFVPTGDGGDALRSAIAEAARPLTEGVMLAQGIRDAFLAGTERLSALAGVALLAAPAEHGSGKGFSVEPRVLEVAAHVLSMESGRPLLEECFGPVSVVVRYDSAEELFEALSHLDPSLTGTVQAAAGEIDLPQRIVELLRHRVGRLIFNGFPTGVAVGWAMHHGGPFPATTAELHTSVGVSAIRRFLRPTCYQDAPDELLPDALRESNPLAIPRRIDGCLMSPGELPLLQYRSVGT